MNPLLKEIRHNPLPWLLAFAPVVFAAQKFKPEAHTLFFCAVDPGDRATGRAVDSLDEAFSVATPGSNKRRVSWALY
jgi:hypothetical protein